MIYSKVRKKENRPLYNKVVNKRCNPPRRKVMSVFVSRCVNASLGGVTRALIVGSIGTVICSLEKT